MTALADTFRLVWIRSAMVLLILKDIPASFLERRTLHKIDCIWRVLFILKDIPATSTFRLPISPSVDGSAYRRTVSSFEFCFFQSLNRPMTQFAQDSRQYNCCYSMLTPDHITVDQTCLSNIAHFWKYIFGGLNTYRKIRPAILRFSHFFSKGAFELVSRILHLAPAKNWKSRNFKRRKLRYVCLLAPLAGLEGPSPAGLLRLSLS